MRTHPDTSERSVWLTSEKSPLTRKVSSHSVANTISRLTQRLSINSSIRWTPASKIDHETVEGRTEFYNQVCHKLLRKCRPPWR
ncbi:hypothetical protein Q1695_002512 [Nippostrongylus brasiliensis]|nr:hypothetical protein Q1695_002512 [Nippostrongylus brasiliensis]